MSDIADSSEVPANRADGRSPDAATSPVAVPAPPSRRSIWRWLWLPLLVIVIAASIWFRYGRQLGMDPLTAPATLAPLASSGEVAVDTLRRTVDDAARVNRAMREQLLGLTQRVGLLEDGLAGVERGAAPGIDAVRLAEADFLLRLGEERLRLFADVSGAREAFALADSQLSEVSDPRATSVRQTLVLERDALAGIAMADLPLILARLDRLADGVDSWPLRGREDASAVAAGTKAPGWWARLTNAIDRYFRVRRVDPDERGGAGPLLRERIALDLSRARLLLLRAQGSAALAAVESARALVAREFDEGDAGVAEALRVLDEIRAAPLAPQLPDLGESRRELARMRGGVTAPGVPADLPAPSPAPEVGTETSGDLPAATETSPAGDASAPQEPATSPAEMPLDDSAADPTRPVPGDLEEAVEPTTDGG